MFHAPRHHPPSTAHQHPPSSTDPPAQPLTRVVVLPHRADHRDRRRLARAAGRGRGTGRCGAAAIAVRSSPRASLSHRSVGSAAAPHHAALLHGPGHDAPAVYPHGARPATEAASRSSRSPDVSPRASHAPLPHALSSRTSSSSALTSFVRLVVIASPSRSSCSRMPRELPQSRSSEPGSVRKKSHDPLGDELRARALAFTDQLVAEAGEVLVKGMRGELPGSDAREQRLCATAIRGERIASAASQPTSAPRVIVQIAPYAQLQAPATPQVWRNGHSLTEGEG